jgi:hypothetical protein
LYGRSGKCDQWLDGRNLPLARGDHKRAGGIVYFRGGVSGQQLDDHDLSDVEHDRSNTSGKLHCRLACVGEQLHRDYLFDRDHWACWRGVVLGCVGLGGEQLDDDFLRHQQHHKCASSELHCKCGERCQCLVNHDLSHARDDRPNPCGFLHATNGHSRQQLDDDYVRHNVWFEQLH